MKKQALLEKVSNFVRKSYPNANVYFLGNTWNIFCEVNSLSNGYIINRGRKLDIQL